MKKSKPKKQISIIIIVYLIKAYYCIEIQIKKIIHKCNLLALSIRHSINLMALKITFFSKSQFLAIIGNLKLFFSHIRLTITRLKYKISILKANYAKNKLKKIYIKISSISISINNSSLSNNVLTHPIFYFNLVAITIIIIQFFFQSAIVFVESHLPFALNGLNEILFSIVFDLIILGLGLFWFQSRLEKNDELKKMTIELLEISKSSNKDIKERKVRIIRDIKNLRAKIPILVEFNLSNFEGYEIDLTSSMLWNPEFSKSNLTGLEFNKAQILQGNAISTKFNYCKFRNGIFHGCDFTDSKFYEVDLSAAQLTDSNFTGADLTGAYNLEIQQLLDVWSLYNCKMEQELKNELYKLKPVLFQKRKNKYRKLTLNKFRSIYFDAKYGNHWNKKIEDTIDSSTNSF